MILQSRYIKKVTNRRGNGRTQMLSVVFCLFLIFVSRKNTKFVLANHCRRGEGAGGLVEEGGAVGRTPLECMEEGNEIEGEMRKRILTCATWLAKR